MLKVYKASAGSGKTYNLTKEYLLLLFGSRFEDGYKHVLAVTFTNKATDEMKERILSELDRLASDPESSPYYSDVVSAGSAKTPEAVRNAAKTIQKSILHDYSRFSVCTIDSFFQRTMRAFAREIGETPSYQVSLSDNDVIAAALDRIYSSLGIDDAEHRRLLDNITAYARELIEDGNSWDFGGPLVDASTDFLKESFKLKAAAKDFDSLDVQSLKRTLNEMTRLFEGKAKAIGAGFAEEIAHLGLDFTDFYKGVNTPLNYFRKLALGDLSSPSATLLAWVSDPNLWCSKSSPLRERIISLAPSLSHFITDADELFTNDGKSYFTARSLKGKLYVLAVFTALRKQMNEVLSDSDSILLSDTPDVLSRIIAGQDAPFIYEKIGIRYDHYMLDEFQDTSKLQWVNFKPLLEESLSYGNDNLVVGDVKQSIYRWRNSDWNMLMGIEDEFSGRVEEPTVLDTNYRSAREIVNFNNSFFNADAGTVSSSDPLPAPIFLQNAFNSKFSLQSDEIACIYSDSFQKVAERNKDMKGHVLVDVVPCDDDRKYVTAESFHNQARQKALEYLGQLMKCGYEYRDIAFLVRTRVDVADITQILCEKGIPVFTDEQLQLSSSKAVLKIVSTLRFLLDNGNPMNLYLKERMHLADADISSLSLYDSVIEIIGRMEGVEGPIEGNEVAFVNAFLDLVLDYVHKEGSDTRAFLSWWDDVGKGQCISSPTECNAVSVMTVHKAKGLQFKAVVIPFFNFHYNVKTSNGGTSIWCSPSSNCQGIEPFSSIPVASVQCGDSLLNTYFSEDYRREWLSTMIDGLNLAYVAFTRAENELIIIAPRAVSRNSTMGTVLSDFVSGNLDGNVAEYGEWTAAVPEPAAREGRNVVEAVQGSFKAVPIGNRLALTLRGGDFFGEGDDNERVKGIVRHDILSKIDSPADLKEAVDYFVLQGELDAELRDSLCLELGTLLESVCALHWFDGTYDSFKECDILSPEGEIVRPDRVLVSKDGSKAEAIVVDFKFGSEKMDKYRTQVSGYMSKLEAMGYASVTGYVWYCSLGAVDRI